MLLGAKGGFFLSVDINVQIGTQLTYNIITLSMMRWTPKTTEIWMSSMYGRRPPGFRVWGADGHSVPVPISVIG